MFRILICALLAAFATGAQAQAWPAKPVTMVNPFAPGGGVDAFGRPLSALRCALVGSCESCARSYR